MGPQRSVAAKKKKEEKKGKNSAEAWLEVEPPTRVSHVSESRRVGVPAWKGLGGKGASSRSHALREGWKRPFRLLGGGTDGFRFDGLLHRCYCGNWNHLARQPCCVISFSACSFYFSAFTLPLFFQATSQSRIRLLTLLLFFPPPIIL